MADQPLDQLLGWDFLGAYAKYTMGAAQIIRPPVEYTAYYISVPLSNWRAGIRGPGYLQFEEVADLHQPGRVLAKIEIHSDDIGAPGKPAWISRSIGAIKLNPAKYYRLVVYTVPTSVRYANDIVDWVVDGDVRPFVWPYKRGKTAYPRGWRQINYNFSTMAVPWHDVPDSDFPFIVGVTELVQYTLSILITPEGAGTVEVSPLRGLYNAGEEVTLTAVPADGQKFLEWSGDASGSDRTITIVMDSAKFVMANFAGTGIPDIPIVSDIIEWLISLFEGIYEWIKDKFSWLLGEVEKVFWAVLNAVLAPITTALNWLQEKILDAWFWLTETIPEVLSWIKEKLGDLWSWVSEKIPEALSWVRDKLGDMWSWVSEKIPEALSWVKDKLEDMWSWVSETIPEALSWVKEKLLDVWEWITEAIPQALDWLVDILSLVWDFILQIRDGVLAFFADPFTWVTDNIIKPMLEPFCGGLERALDEEAAKED